MPFYVRADFRIREGWRDDAYNGHRAVRGRPRALQWTLGLTRQAAHVLHDEVCHLRGECLFIHACVHSSRLPGSDFFPRSRLSQISYLFSCPSNKSLRTESQSRSRRAWPWLPWPGASADSSGRLETWSTSGCRMTSNYRQKRGESECQMIFFCTQIWLQNLGYVHPILLPPIHANKN